MLPITGMDLTVEITLGGTFSPNTILHKFTNHYHIFQHRVQYLDDTHS